MTDTKNNRLITCTIVLAACLSAMGAFDKVPGCFVMKNWALSKPTRAGKMSRSVQRSLRTVKVLMWVLRTDGSKAGVILLPDVCRTSGALVALSLSPLPYEFPIGKVSFREMALVATRIRREILKTALSCLHSSHEDLSSLISEIMPLDELPSALEKAKSGQCVASEP